MPKPGSHAREQAVEPSTIPPTRAPASSREYCGVETPYQLNFLADLVDRSKWMLDLKPDWDGQGSPAYQPATLAKAGALLLNGAKHYLDRFSALTPEPKIENGPDGSVDIFWERSDRELLINVPAEAGAHVQYYGRSGDGFHIKGIVPAEEPGEWFPVLMLWLGG